MKRMHLIIVLLLTLLLCAGCYWDRDRVPKKILKYILKTESSNELDHFDIYLKDALGMDYDTLFLFTARDVATIRNAIGIDNYKPSMKPNRIIGRDSDDYLLILKKDGHVIYDNVFDQYYTPFGSDHPPVSFVFDSFEDSECEFVARNIDGDMIKVGFRIPSNEKIRAHRIKKENDYMYEIYYPDKTRGYL